MTKNYEVVVSITRRVLVCDAEGESQAKQFALEQLDMGSQALMVVGDTDQIEVIPLPSARELANARLQADAVSEPS